MLQLACTYPHGCTGTRRRRLTGIKQEEKWISPLFPAKIKLVINVCSIVNERVGKCATSTDRAFLIAQRKDNESQTALPPRHQQQNLNESTLAEETRTSSCSKSCRITIRLGSRLATGKLKKNKKKTRQQARVNPPSFFRETRSGSADRQPSRFFSRFLCSCSSLEVCTHAGELMQMSACKRL